ncbi:unnamed protein product [Chilo suppressalis]|uniref:Partial AB-hydrolase lipase domain-containing protein n=1 Tax=Chilo suppressalis TaxID=168631 RepID=A0ABN8AV48_CHISP|nr:unnamed protein product [Chilo suppressalis]
MKSCTCSIFLVSLLFNVDADILVANETVRQLVQSAGYPVERHYVHTSDGYILQVYRIPHGRAETNRIEGKKKAVVLFHGLTGSCDNYLIMGPKKSLAYYLADVGYDVWLANLRGNFYTSHTKLTRKDPAFWDYSFDEHGKYDAPVIIDKILEETGLSRVLYIGHSMGCTTFLTMLAQRPEYNDKLVAFVGLGPAAYLNNIQGYVHFLLNNLNLRIFLPKLDIGAIIIPRKVLEFTSKFCAPEYNMDLCLKYLYSLIGEDYEQNAPRSSKFY